MRYGRPVAKIVPIVPKRNLDPLPGFVGKVKMHGDWFGDDSSEWENA
jgi:antitoxin (DNA-binding transcriptional repressor) of toxin-antitoxin stability system